MGLFVYKTDGDPAGFRFTEQAARVGRFNAVDDRIFQQVQERFDQAGILVEDAKLTHLAYAPEIAGVMLRRQQAEAITRPAFISWSGNGNATLAARARPMTILRVRFTGSPLP